MSKKITDLTQLSSPHLTDMMLIDDLTGGATKKIALSDLAAILGLNLPAGAVSAANINFGGSGSGIWWQEIARTTWSSGATLATSSFTAKKYLHIIFIQTDTTIAATASMTFNSDTAGNYGNRRSLDGAADNTGGSQTSTEIHPNYKGVSRVDVFITNISGSEKVGFVHGVYADGTGAAAIPNKAEYAIKWTGSSQITSVSITRAANMAAGSEIVVLGHD